VGEFSVDNYNPDGLEYLVHETQFDPLRDHVRRIYETDKKWGNPEDSSQVIYEYDILAIEDKEYLE
jgi:hypothetical protein